MHQIKVYPLLLNLFYLQLVHSITFALLDQQATLDSCFSAEWTFKEGTQSLPSAKLCKPFTCGTLGTFFGPLNTGQSIQRTYTNLDTHTRLQVRFTFLKLDLFGDDDLVIQADNAQYWVTFAEGGSKAKHPTLTLNREVVSQACHAGFAGSVPSDDAYGDYTLTIPHTAQSLTLKFFYDFLVTSGAWGLRNIKVFIEIDCNIACNKCTTTDQCTVCAFNRIGIPTCACPSGTFDSGQPECQSCLAQCATCSNATSCVTCPAGREGPLCSCASGFYEINGQCQRCSGKCATCANATSCITCALNREGSNCLCRSGFYDSYGTCTGIHEIYSACDLKCATCDPTTGACLTCQSPARVLPFCDCGPKRFEDAQKQCTDCLSTCATCSDSSTCLTCPANRSGPQCNCPLHQFEAGNGVCSDCNYKCATCSNAAVCLTCKPNRSGPECQCLVGYYEQNQACFQCYSSCRTCDASGCLTCPDIQQSPPFCLCPNGTKLQNHVCVPDPTSTTVTGQFSDDLDFVVLTFSEKIQSPAGQYANYPAASNCDVVENIESICHIKENQFFIKVTEAVNYKIGSSINLKPNGITALGQTASNFGAVFLQPPLANSPSFDIQHPQFISSCAPSQITLSNFVGYGPKSPSIQYESNPPLGNLGNQTIAQINNAPLGTQTITVTVSSFIGTSTKKTITIQVQDQDVHTVTIRPLLGAYYAYMDLTLEADIQLFSCQTKATSSKLSAIWRLDDQIVEQIETYSGMIRYQVLSQSFKPGSSHTISIEIILDGKKVSDKVSFIVQPAPILLTIIGGSRMISAKLPVNLKGMIVNPDNVDATPTWLCTEVATGAQCSHKFSSDLSQTIPSNTLKSGAQYQIQLRAGTAQTSITLLAQSELQQNIEVKYPVRYNTMPVNLDEDLIFAVQIIQDGVTYQIDSSSQIKYSIIERGNLILSRVVTRSVITFKLNTLSITADEVTIQFVYGALIAFVKLQINHPPSNGRLKATLSGTAMKTNYQIEIQDFQDKHLPLQFQYSYLLNDGSEMMLSDWVSSNVFKTQLPQGRYGDYKVTLVGRVSDSYGSVTEVEWDVVVLPSDESRLLAESSTSKLAEQLKQETNLQTLAMLVSQYLQMQNDGCAKKCSGHGHCDSNAKCECQASFALDDCSATQAEFKELVSGLKAALAKIQDADQSNLSQVQRDQLARVVNKIIERPEITESVDATEVASTLDNTLSNLNSLFQDQSPTPASTDQMMTQLPDPQKNRKSRQKNSNVQSQANVMGALFSTTSYESAGKFDSKEDQDKLNKELVKSSRDVSSYFANQLLPDQEPTNIKNRNLQIHAQRVTQGQSVQYFPYSNYLITNLDEQELQILNEVGIQNEVEMSSLTFNTNPYNADSQFPYQNQTNQMAGANFKDVEGNPVRPRRQLSYSLKAKPSPNNICVTQSDGKWTSNGCSTLNNLIDGSSQCNCNSITEITVVDDIAAMFKNSNIDALWNPGALADFAFWESALFYISVILTGCWIVCMVIGWKKDVNDFSEFMKTQALQRSQQQSDPKMLDEADEDSDEELKQKQKELQENRHIVRDFMFGFPMLHQFISIFTMFSDEQPRPARFTIYFLKMIIMMALTSLFGKNLSITQNVVFTVMCVALMAPITAALLKGFAHDASKIKKIISVIFIASIFGGCWYVCLVVAAKMGVEDSNTWSATYIISLACDILIMETLTIFLKLVLGPYIKARIHSGNFMIRILYLYIFEKNMDQIIRKMYG